MLYIVHTIPSIVLFSSLYSQAWSIPYPRLRPRTALTTCVLPFLRGKRFALQCARCSQRPAYLSECNPIGIGATGLPTHDRVEWFEGGELASNPTGATINGDTVTFSGQGEGREANWTCRYCEGESCGQQSAPQPFFSELLQVAMSNAVHSPLHSPDTDFFCSKHF